MHVGQHIAQAIDGLVDSRCICFTTEDNQKLSSTQKWKPQCLIKPAVDKQLPIQNQNLKKFAAHINNASVTNK